jgi:hypothetical protein
MAGTKEAFIKLLESDIRVWESLATYFEGIHVKSISINDVEMSALNKAQQMRDRIKEHQDLINKIKESN